MAWVPGFQHDVFVSYAHVDDRFVRPETAGWVTSFVEELKTLLPPRLGRSEGLSIWADARLRGNADVDREILAAVESSAMLICVLSEGWISSGYCASELSSFNAVALQQEADRPTDRCHRALKVLLSNVPPEKQPPPLNAQNGHRFFAPEGQVDEIFRRTEQKDSDQRHWQTLHKVLWDVAQTLREIAEERGKRLVDAPPLPPRAGPSAPRVFFAEVTDDLDSIRGDLEKSLAQKGLAIVPEAPLPLEKAALDERLTAELSGCAVSVHLLGAHYGRRLSVGGPSLPHVQLEAASRANVRRLVWMDRALNLRALSNEAQRALVDEIEAAGAELVQCRLEELKDLVLARAAPEQPPTQPSVDRGALVYVAALPEDEAAAKRLAALFSERRHDVMFAAHSADAEAQRHHERNLQSCDAFVVLYGNSVVWARDHVINARRLAKQHRVAPNLVLSVLDGPPPTKTEDLGLEFKDLLVLPCRDRWPPDRMQDLLRRLEAHT